MTRVIFLFLLLIISGVSSLAQLPSVGQWRDHLPYSSIKAVVHTGQKAFGATAFSIAVYDEEDGSLSRLTTINALSDQGISSMAFDATTGKVVVGYSSGNIDLVNSSDLQTTNLGDIKRSPIVGDKTIYSILCDNGIAYLATGIGVIKLDLQREEVKDSYLFLSGSSYIRVNEVGVLGDTLFAATETGILKGYIGDPFLSDFSKWTPLSVQLPYLQTAEISHLVAFQNEIVFSTRQNAFQDDTVYRYQSGSTLVISSLVGQDIFSLRTRDQQRLAVVGNYGVRVFDASFSEVENLFSYQDGPMEPRDIDFGTNNFYWIGDRVKGWVKAINSWASFNMTPQGPYSAGSFRLAIDESNVWVAAGNVYGAAWLNSYSNEFASGKDEDDNWVAVSKMNSPFSFSDSLFDAVALAVDPNDPDHVFMGTMSFYGLVEVQNGVVVAKYDETNSSLQGWVLRPGYCGITDMTFDEEGNLWVANAFVDRSLSVRKTDGTWKSFDLGVDMKNRVFRELIVAKNGYKWFAITTSAQNGGVFVWNDNGTIDDETDDEGYFYRTGAGTGNLPSTDVYSIAEDLDGEIWIGTSAGIAVVYSPESVFSGGNFDAQQILIEQDGNIQLLLETEVVTAIAVDGANRKWIGTDGSGVYLMSEDGSEQILHFTKENSPLLANQINDIAIDHLTGEVYFATAGGLISYRGTATIEKRPFSEVYAFPNPVESGYDGPITIKGLSRNSEFRITDLSGNLIFAGKSEGGQAIWYGTDLSGNRVPTGVYTVLTNSFTGKSKAVAKILFVR